MAVQLAPRVVLFRSGSTLPAVERGWLALADAGRAPGEAEVFGDGSHATTRLCAGVVDFICTQRQPAAVLDVGTGTGVLARIARARGATFIVGTDIDPDALKSAGRHAALDGHPVAIRFGAQPPDHWGARFELVVANILEAPLRELAPALIRAVAPGGVLLLSGFTRPQAPALRVLYERGGVRFVSDAQLGEWVLLRFER